MFDGEAHAIIGWDGPAVRLRADSGLTQRVETVAMFDAHDFEVLGVETESQSLDASSALDDLPAHVRQKAIDRLAHLNEAFTGYRSGLRDGALSTEPRPEYDPAITTLEQRVSAKSRETSCSRRTMFRDLQRYQEYGLWGLVDKRSARLTNPFDLDPRVHAAVVSVLDELTEKSNVSKAEIRRRTKKKLIEQYGGDVSCPPRATFNAKLDELTRGRGTFGAAKARRSIANRPPTPYQQFQVTRPGEVVQIDSSPWNVFAVDSVSGRWVALDLTIALDLYTRAIVAHRFTPRSAKGVDAALILADIVGFKPMRAGWPDSARARYLGVPDAILVEAAGFEPSSIPAVRPETVVVDHGRIFQSGAFRDGCARLGISIQLARPHRPTDKPQIERMFRTIDEFLAQTLPGYRGPSVHSRGARVEDDAFLFVDELDDLFARWVASYWHVRQHDGLRLPGQPEMHLSPAEMYDEGLARWGLLYVPPSKTLYYELLPTAWRKIHHYGVELNGLRYDGDALNEFRNRTSSYGGVHRGDWPLKFDPRDLSKVFFQRPDTSEWHELYWVGATDPDRPFNDLTLGYAKRLIVERRGDNLDLDQILTELLGQLDHNELERRAELQRLGKRQRIHVHQLDRDRGMTVDLTVDVDEHSRDAERRSGLDRDDSELDDIEPMEMLYGDANDLVSDLTDRIGDGEA